MKIMRVKITEYQWNVYQTFLSNSEKINPTAQQLGLQKEREKLGDRLDKAMAKQYPWSPESFWSK